MANPLLPALGDEFGVQLTVVTVTQAQLTAYTTFDYLERDGHPASTAIMNELLVEWYAQNSGDYLACLSDQCTMTQIVARSLTDDTLRTQVFIPPAGPVVGTVVSPPIDSMLAAVLTRQTAIRGRRGAGRFYMPAVPHTFIAAPESQGLLSAGALAIYENLNDNLSDIIVCPNSRWDYALVSSPIPPSTVATRGAPITSTGVNLGVGTQRRRRTGVGI